MTTRMKKTDYELIAGALRKSRPAVLPGTNYIPNDWARKTWYDAVTEVADALHRDNPGFDSSKFFDIAGVPS